MSHEEVNRINILRTLLVSEPQHVPNCLQRQRVLSLPVDIQRAKEHFSPCLVITLASIMEKSRNKTNTFNAVYWRRSGKLGSLSSQWKLCLCEHKTSESEALTLPQRLGVGMGVSTSKTRHTLNQPPLTCTSKQKYYVFICKQIPQKAYGCGANSRCFERWSCLA